MGVWGKGLLQNDTAADIYNAYFSLFNLGMPASNIVTEIERRFYTDDPDEHEDYWIALAKAQWECGVLEYPTLEQVRLLIFKDEFSEWAEENGKARRSILEKFYERIQTSNNKPKRPIKPRVGKPIFQPGSRLSITLEDGRYGAALVLANQTLGNVAYDLVVLLDYLSENEPELRSFENLQPLRLHHYSYKNTINVAWYFASTFKKVCSRIRMLGLVEAPATEVQSSTYSSWTNLGKQVLLQRAWDRDHREN